MAEDGVGQDFRATDGADARGGPRAALGLLLALLLPWLLARQVASPPPVQPLGASASSFSAARALADLEALAGEGLPHPAGTEEAARLRERLVALGRGRGWTLEPSTRMAVGPEGAGVVHNLVLELPGRRDEWVLVMAHTDSVGAGPGIADDLAGVAAVLEAVRARLAQGPLERGLLVVFTDAEEDGLHGARAFARKDPRMDRVACVLNLEARGCRGPSLMFQVGPGSGDLVREWAARAPHPFADSISEAAYARMPNDTDFSVTRDLGLPGLNFAFVGGVEVYHTPLDDLAHLDPRSLQHQGEHLLAGLEAADVARFEDAGRSAWLTLLGTTWVVPAAFVVPAALLALACALAGALLRTRRGELEPGALRSALLRVLPLLLLPALLSGAVAQLLARLSGEAAFGQLHPGLGSAAAAGAALWALCGVAPRHLGAGGAGAAARRAALPLAAALALAVLALACGVWDPGAGVTLVPAAALAALAALLAPPARRGRASAVPVALACSSALALLHGAPLVELFSQAFGGRAPQVPVAIGCLLGGPAVVQLAQLGARMRRGLALAGALAVVASLAAAALIAAGTEERPTRESVVLDWSEDEGLTRRGERVSLLEVGAPQIRVARPRLEVLSQEPVLDGTRVRARIAGGGPWGRLTLEGVDEAWLEGVRLESGALRSLRLFGMERGDSSREGLLLELVVPESGALLSVRMETPLAALDLDAAGLRAPRAVPSHRGDRLRIELQHAFGAWREPRGEDAQGGDAGPLPADEEEHGH